ncbi:MAG: chromate efflux transporter [Ignavibacteria bacterium]|nr:chromate efflux transporter [Ignavibacteria bacterium]
MLKKIIKYFFTIGATTFGGPLAIIDTIRKDLVEKRKWLDSTEFENIMGYSQIAPGAYAYQVAMYVGYKLAKIPGAILAGVFLVLPSFLLMLLFSYFYSVYKDVSYFKFAIYGIAPVITAIITQSGFNLMISLLKKDIFLYFLFFVSIFFTIFLKIQIIYIIIASAFISLLYYSLLSKNKLLSFLPILLLLITLINNLTSATLEKLAILFFKIGALTYGSGFVIVGVLRQEVVENLHWLTPNEFLDGLVFGQITPGPVVITSTFIGYLTSGFVGAVVATISIFLPTTIFVILLTNYVYKIKNNFYIRALIKGANAGALGAIISTAYFIALDSIQDYYTIGFLLASFLILNLSKIKPIFIIIAFGVIGILFKILI